MAIPPLPPRDAFLMDAFPSPLRPRMAAALAAMRPAAYHLPGHVSAIVAGESVTLPYRIYNPEPSRRVIARRPPVEQQLLHCIFTRHNDGHVRQRHLEAIVASPEAWVVPFVVQLVGEYVLEIIEVIRQEIDHLAPGSTHQESYRRFAIENQPFLHLTEARVISYWNEYYRHRYPNRAAYAGTTVMEALLDFRQSEPT